MADLIIALTLPFKILSETLVSDPGSSEAAVCRFSAVIFYDTMYVGITLLGLIAFKIVLKIIRPFRENSSLQKPAFAKGHIPHGSFVPPLAAKRS